MNAPAKDWFRVDKEGLAAILQRRGVEFALFELVSNALDTHAHSVDVSIEPVAGRPIAHVVVTDDDPEGFQDLAHAFTLFAPSSKKGSLEKRGRFNLGEKLVLAICDSACIASTTGMVMFDADGRHDFPRRKRDTGSQFTGELRMTREEMERVIVSLGTLLVPEGVHLVVNGARKKPRKSIATFEATLATELADADGNLKRSRARAHVEVHEPYPGEIGTLYEMGIPVVETGDRFHVNVLQKVPLDMDRSNVPPAFLRELRAHVLNAMADKITPEIATASWVREAAGSPLASIKAVEAALTARFGEKRVSYDPSDAEANKLAVASGYTVVHGGSLTGDEWESVRRTETLLPAGKVTPSPKPFTPGGAPAEHVPRDEWTPGMVQVVSYTEELALRLLDRDITVSILKTFNASAAYGKKEGVLYFNLSALGHQFFDQGASLDVDRLLLHEFAHEFCSDHLDDEFAEAGFKLGAKLKRLALDEPEFFRKFERQ